MSQAELDALERDVEAARGRLAGDVARVRDPAALTGFKTAVRMDVVANASSLRDQLVHKAAESATDSARQVWSDLKARAAANPAAAFAIGAGLAWHFARHPPITTLLVGLGVSSLLRTSPTSRPSPIVDRAAELGGTVGEKVHEWSEEARDMVGKASGKAREWGEQARDAAGQALSHVSHTATELAGQTSDVTTRIAGQTADVATREFADDETRDNYLLGAATFAVAAATVIAIQRRDG